MFKGAHNALQKGVREYEPPINPGVMEVYSSDFLLASDKYQQLLKNIRSFVALPTSDYEHLYLNTIKNFTDFVQLLPETKTSYFSYTGGLLDHGIERAYLALSLSRTFLLPPNAPKNYTSPAYELWLYAIFTAALLLDVGKIATKQCIMMCERNGKEIKLWLPYEGSMLAQRASHYTYTFEQGNRNRLQNMVTPLLARQLLEATAGTQDPQKANGFAWIASDKDVLEAWLAMLQQDATGFGALLTIIPLAQSQSIAQYFAEIRKFMIAGTPKQGEIGKQALPTDKLGQQVQTSKLFKTPDVAPGSHPSDGSVYTIPTVPGSDTHAAAHTNVATGSVASTVRPEVLMGHAFLNWLSNLLKNSSQFNVMHPDSQVRLSSNGLFIDQKVFEKFAATRDIKDGKTVQKYFDLLEISSTSTSDKLRGVIVTSANMGLLLSENMLQKIAMSTKLPFQILTGFDSQKPTPK